MHRYAFFSGKGGVGKTTLAAATAVRAAEEGKRTLIVSTDPAGNLADVFERPIGNRVTEIAPNLFALEIDPDSATRQYRDRALAPLRAVLPPDAMKVLEEQFRSACTVEIASFDRFTDFLGDTEFDHVVFDTAPTGHTLRLLELPVDWSRHIEEAARGTGQTCIGPVASLQGAKAKYDRAIAVLRNPLETEFTLVCRPERTSVDELLRAREEIRALGIGNFRIVVNGVIPAGSGSPFGNLESSQREQIRRLSGMVDDPCAEVPLQGGEVKGLSGLGRFAAIAFDGKTDHLHGGFAGASPFKGFSTPHTLRKMLTGGTGSRTVVLTGKGGVGKTVAACALAARLAREGKRILLATTDPAAHIGQVLSADVSSEVRPVTGYPGLFAVRIDQKESVEAYKAKILSQAAASGHTGEMLAVVREELESPCTEEMAVFEEFSGLVERDDFDVVVLDTAPTGHTLRLLELPYDYARQVEMMVAVRKDEAGATGAKGKLDALVRRLKDPVATAFLTVIYPEYTPIFEAKRAAEDLKESGIEVQGVIANFLLEESDCSSTFSMSRYRMQQHYLRVAEETFRLPIFKVPMLPSEPAGKDALERVGGELLGEPPATKRLNVFERYLSLWVAICMVVGIFAGKMLPGAVDALRGMEFGTDSQINIPIAVLIWLMIYPMMLKVDFTSILGVRKKPKGLIVTLVVNWLVKPFSMALFGYVFFKHLFLSWIGPELADQYLAGTIILAAAPCTAMVFVWSYLTDGDPAYTLVQVSVNDLIMLVLFAPIVKFLISGASSLTVPFMVLVYAVVFFIVIPLAAGIVSRTLLIRAKGTAWFEKFLSVLHPVTVVALLATLVCIFAFQADNITARSFHILLIAAPILIQVYFNSSLAYGLMKRLKVPHSVAAPGALIGASNFFELAVATAIALYGPGSGAALATVVGVLVEVPVMLSVCSFCNRTRHWFPAVD